MFKHELYDLTHLSEQVRGNRESVGRFVDIFLTTVPLDLEALRSAIEEQNWPKSKSAAHKMKSSFLLMGADWAAGQCAQMETMAQAGEETKKLPEMFRELEQKYLAMEAALKELTF